ncbi:extracellular solute-binding protein [Cohnella silvisoli]|uniref:Extracellular solute-binding protein n=1 Tax=Cohnella silvisoli TaxID=2873699 RepID=A0ABV1L2M6_9BACL|nr:extracellular solute-binding protein [Cohnella silvisoli]MCD9025939.1 extracellular solute-binding protein [Cohnella silvisoli]
MVVKKWKQLALVMLVLALVTVTACSKDNNGEKASNSPSDSPSANASASSSSTTAKQTVPDGPTGKYDPPIELTTVRSVNAGVKFQAGDSLDSNVWTKDFESVLGIKVINKWKVSDQQYQNKMAVTMASGDLPDFMLVDAQQFQILVQAGTIADLTDVYAKYASELTKKSIEEGGGLRLKASTVNGKIMGIPADGGGRDDAHSIYIRTDWLKNVGLEPPKTMDDVIKIATAFTKNDPDKNGKNDTYGLSLDMSLFNGWSGLEGFFNGYHAYPFNPTKGTGTNLNFVKGADGKAAWADVQPEVKTALGKLQELFKAGAIYPEFSVIDGIKSGELVTSNKVGMAFGAFWVPTWPINNMKKDLPGSDWGIYPIVSADDKPVMAQSTGGLPSKYYVVSKESKHPEAPFILLNRYVDKLFSNFDQAYHSVDADGVNYAFHMYPPINGSFAEKNQDAAYAVQDAINSKDPSKLDTEQKQYYDQVEKYRAGDLSLWAAEKLWAPGGSFDVIGQYKKENRIFQSVFTGNPTPTMVAKGPSLRDEEVRTFTSIIMGAKPLDYFDEWVTKWMDSGGKDILDEVNSSGQIQ